MMVTLYVLLIIPPDENLDVMEIELCKSKTHAEDIIHDCQRLKTYDGYTYKIAKKEVYFDIRIS